MLILYMLEIFEGQVKTLEIKQILKLAYLTLS